MGFGRKTENVSRKISTHFLYCLANLFRDQSTAAYKKQLLRDINQTTAIISCSEICILINTNSFRTFPLVREGRNKSGFIIDASSKRLNPFGLLANRTIGLSRDNAQNVGLERTYDSLLRGENGRKTGSLSECRNLYSGGRI